MFGLSFSPLHRGAKLTSTGWTSTPTFHLHVRPQWVCCSCFFRFNPCHMSKSDSSADPPTSRSGNQAQPSNCQPSKCSSPPTHPPQHYPTIQLPTIQLTPIQIVSPIASILWDHRWRSAAPSSSLRCPTTRSSGKPLTSCCLRSPSVVMAR